MKVCFGQLVDNDFLERLWTMVVKFGWSSEQMNHLMACMAFESALTFKPDIKNAAGSGAVGLIQFMPITAMHLGTTANLLAKMTAVQQLDYVEKYFEPYADRICTLSDMYMAILAPAYIGKAGTTTIYSNPTIQYRQNAALDKNNDGMITKEEATTWVKSRYDMGFLDKYVKEWMPAPSEISLQEPEVYQPGQWRIYPPKKQDSIESILDEIDVLFAKLKRMTGHDD